MVIGRVARKLARERAGRPRGLSPDSGGGGAPYPSRSHLDAARDRGSDRLAAFGVAILGATSRAALLTTTIRGGDNQNDGYHRDSHHDHDDSRSYSQGHHHAEIPASSGADHTSAPRYIP